jgi:hypothetical protein
MGTRHLVCVVLDGEYKVAQYGQWDGYLTGQGQTIAEFICKKMVTREFRKQLKKIHFIKNEKEFYKKACTELNINPDSGFITMTEAERFKEKYPYLDRDMGADILLEIQEGRVPFVKNSLDFAQDSLFCEWVYILNMDKRVLEIRGSITKPYKKIPFKSITMSTMKKIEKEYRKADRD